MPFETSEYESRVRRLQAEMKARNLDAVLIDDSEAMAYFFGFDTSLSFYRAGVVTAAAGAFIVLRALDAGPCRERSWVDDIVGHADWDDPVAALADKIRTSGLARARIGLDFGSHALTVAIHRKLEAALPGMRIVDLAGLPWLMRLVKSPAEIVRLRKACEIGDAAIEALAATVRSGMTERDLARIAVETYIERGGDPGHPGIFAIRRDSDLDFLHGHLHDAAIAEGDTLHLEINPRFEGYGARMMRALFLGDAAPGDLVDVYERMAALQDAQIRAMTPGARANDVDRIVREGAVAAGLRRDYTNITGYVMGFYPDYMLRASDFTRVFLPTSDWSLEAGMVFHMYTSAAGLGVSETVLVTPQGGERLTRSARVLQVRPAAPA